MGLFTKKTHTRIERDEEGKAVLTKEEVPRRRIFERKPVETKELTYEEQFPKEIQPEYVRQRRVKKLVSTGKKVDAWVGRNIQPIGGYQSKPVQRKSYSPRRSSPIYNNYNPFGSTFDTGVKPMSRPKTQSRTKYKVIGGKAYPIAGSKKKTKRKTSKRKTSMGGFDMMDSYGFFK